MWEEDGAFVKPVWIFCFDGLIGLHIIQRSQKCEKKAKICTLSTFIGSEIVIISQRIVDMLDYLAKSWLL